MKNILITGGAGFIGSHTVVELCEAGFRPVIIDNFANSDRKVLVHLENLCNQKLSFYEGDFGDTSLLEKVFTKESIDGVVHFAAYKAVGESVSKPLDYYDNNVKGLINLLAVMDKHQINSLVFSSSCTVYGDALTLPITEEEPTKPATSPYGSTKQMGETIIKDATVASDQLRAISLRYFNPIGAHSSGLIGELPIGVPANLIPFVTQTAAGLREKLIVYGNDYNTSDGTCIRDYIHVVDLAKAHVSAIRHLATKTNGFYDTFNIGTGKGSSVLEVIQTFEKVTGKKLNYQIGPRRTGDVVSAYASVEKAHKHLNWKSELDLKQALIDAWKWRQNPST